VPRFLLATAVVPLLVLTGEQTATGPSYVRVYDLQPAEGVFAYSRISPDGNTLAYASEGPSGRRTVTVVDLPTKKVVFAEPGIDAYFSPDGERMIYLSTKSGSSLTIRNMKTGVLSRNVASVGLGDYYSWAFSNGKNLILTIESNYYYLNGDKAVLPHSRVPACPDIGIGERPLIARDGVRISTFVRGNIVVRNLRNCAGIINTGIKGQKADFSWDGRYIAFHALKKAGAGYEIRIVDLQERTVRTLSGLKGSAYFPSWTKDGRLSFRYDGADYKGFMVVSNALAVPAERLPKSPEPLPSRRTWEEIFPGTPVPATALAMVLVWAPWSAHSQDAFAGLERTRTFLHTRRINISFLTAADPANGESEIKRQLAIFGASVPRLSIAPPGLAMIEANGDSSV
jgi:hypothetical protein